MNLSSTQKKTTLVLASLLSIVSLAGAHFGGVTGVLASLPVTPPISIPVTPVTRPWPVTAPLPDPVVIVSFDSQASLGSENVEFVSIEVKLSERTKLPVSVDYALSGGTAIKDEDFRLNAGTLVIEAGQRTGIIRVRVNDDHVIESMETIQIMLSNPVNAEPGRYPVHTYTIVDND